MDLSWYNSLSKPFFTPPSWVFGPIWTVLYLFMGISALIIFKHGWKKKNVRNALSLFSWQLFLNLIWTPIFFGAHQIVLALVIIILLWYLILKTIKAFAAIDKTASLLLYPYIIWVTIAALLNLSILYLNR